MTLVGKKAPSFQAPAVINGNEIVQNFSLEEYIGKQAVVLFFYPKDFTFVCPTEIYGLQQRMNEFMERNVAVVGCSTDTEETHWAWLHVDPSQGGIQGVQYPLIADTSKTIAANFGVLGGDWYVDENNQLQFEGSPIAHRGVFLIDKEGIIRHMLVNDLPLGRSIDEILRTIDVMQHVEKYGEVCPVNWKTGEAAFQPTSEALREYLAQQMVSESSCETYPCDTDAACAPKKKCNNCRCGNANCGCKGRCAPNGTCNNCGCERENCRCETKQPTQPHFNHEE